MSKPTVFDGAETHPQQPWQVHCEETQTLTAEQTLCSFDSSLLIGWDKLEVASCSCTDIHFAMTAWHIGLHVTSCVLLALPLHVPHDLWLCFLPLYRLSFPITNGFSLLIHFSKNVCVFVSQYPTIFFWTGYFDVTFLPCSCHAAASSIQINLPRLPHQLCCHCTSLAHTHFLIMFFCFFVFSEAWEEACNGKLQCPMV